MNLQGLAIKRPVATITILLIMVVIGAVSLSQTPLNLLPEIQPPVLAIITIFPGSSPQESMALVSRPIEDALASVGGLTNIQSISQENMSVVILQFHWGADLKSARAEVDTRLDFLPIPDGVNRPMVSEFDPTLLPVMELAASGEDNVALTTLLQERVAPRLEALPGVASVQLVGEAKEDIFVRLSPAKLQQHKVSFEQVSGILRTSTLDFPAGIVELDQRQMRLRFLGSSSAMEALESMVVGFQVDEVKLQEQLNRTVKVDINRQLNASIPAAADIVRMPVKQITLRDVLEDWEMDSEGYMILSLDVLKLGQRGLNPTQVAQAIAATGNKPAFDGSPHRIRIAEPDLSSATLGAIPVAETPDLEAWYRSLQAQAGNMDVAVEKIEQALVSGAMAIVQMSQGGSLPFIGDDFPLQPVSLRDIATIETALHPPDTISRVNQNPSIGITIQKEGAANTVQVARLIRAELEAIKDQYPDTYFYPVFDQAGEIENALEDLAISLLGGAALAIVVLLLFLRNWRTTVLIGTAIPVSIMFTFSLLYFTNLSINIMTLGGLALAAGLLVDNAIVVSENIYRHLQAGACPNEAAISGTREVAGAVFASTITTITVFFPVVFIGGLAGELFSDFALTVSCALIASLLVSLTLIPLLASRFFREGDEKGKTLGSGTYKRILGLALAKPLVPLLIGLIVLVTGGVGYTFLGSDLFPPTQEKSFVINVTLPPGTPLSQTDAFVAELEAILSERPEVSRFTARVGGAQFMGLPMQGGTSNQARIRVRVAGEYLDQIEAIMDELRPEMCGLREDALVLMQRENLLQTAGMDNRLELVVEGEDRGEITEIARRAVLELAQLPFLADVQYSLEETRPEVHIEVDQNQILQRGVSVYQVASMLRMAIEGTNVARVPLGNDFIQMILTYDRSELASTDDLLDLGLYGPSGSWLRLGDVARLEQAYGPASITRQNRLITGEIQAEYFGMSMSNARDGAMAALADMELPEGYNIRTAGTFALLDDVFSDLWLVLVVAAVLVYLVMSAQFESFLNPFIIICSLPLAYVGSILTLLLTGNSLSIPAMIGGIVLAGILVNDGIILVDLISQKHRSGTPLQEAVIEGACARLRPVLMTTITTVLGVMPLALGLGAGSQLQAPMGLAIIGGQVFGTTLLLIIIPLLYSLINRRTQKSPS